MCGKRLWTPHRKPMAGAFAQYGFLEDLHTDKERRCVELRKHMAFGIKDRQSYTGVQCWRRRKSIITQIFRCIFVQIASLTFSRNGGTTKEKR